MTVSYFKASALALLITMFSLPTFASMLGLVGVFSWNGQDEPVPWHTTWDTGPPGPEQVFLVFKAGDTLEMVQGDVLLDYFISHEAIAWEKTTGDLLTSKEWSPAESERGVILDTGTKAGSPNDALWVRYGWDSFRTAKSSHQITICAEARDPLLC
jgi:hypothetical protein